MGFIDWLLPKRSAQPRYIVATRAESVEAARKRDEVRAALEAAVGSLSDTEYLDAIERGASARQVAAAARRAVAEAVGVRG